VGLHSGGAVRGLEMAEKAGAGLWGGPGGLFVRVPALGAGAPADVYLPLLHSGAVPGDLPAGSVPGHGRAGEALRGCPGGAAGPAEGHMGPGNAGGAGGGKPGAVRGILPGDIRAAGKQGVCK